MTKKDYVLIARAIKNTKQYINNSYIYGDHPSMTRDQYESFLYAYHIAEQAVDFFIKLLGDDNSKFNKNKFIEACKIVVPEYKII